MTTSIEEALRSGAVRLVPVEATPEMVNAAWRVTEVVPANERMGVLLSSARTAHSVKMLRRWKAMLSASPDHTPALVALIEERDRLMVERDEARLLFDTMASTAEEALAQREAAEAKCDALREQIAKLKKDNT